MSDTKKPRKELRRMSDKQRAKLTAEGHASPRSTLRSSPSPSKPRGTKQGMMRRSWIAKVGKQKAKRVARNREYYRSAEWRAKRKAVFERDGYRCTEIIRVAWEAGGTTAVDEFRCETRGEVVNGKQTARGLVAEETGYQHRGVEGAIDRIRTRCKDCDRRLTPIERINHAHGFQSARRARTGAEG